MIKLSAKHFCLFALACCSPVLGQQRPTAPQAPTTYGKVPLAFERNAGQTATQVKYLSRGKGYSLFLTPNEATFALQKNKEGAVVKMQLLGSNPHAKETAFNKLPGTTNYFIGKDKSQWRTGVANYSKVGFSDVYKGVDVVYYGNQKNLEYDFVVQPNASPSSIHLKFAGAKRVTSVKGGALSLDMGNGNLQWHAPVAYQELGGKRVQVSAKYVLKGKEVAFVVGSYDTTKPLVIDPELVYSTYLGGSGYDYGNAITVDSAGNAYITGVTASVDFPVTTWAFQTKGGGFYGDAFVSKLSANGKSLLYSTYLGGSGYDYGNAIAVDSVGNAYITGDTYSADFPVTTGAFQTKYGDGADAFVSKLSANGKSLLYSTYLGGATSDDFGCAIVVDGNGIAYVAGRTSSTDFPVTTGAFQTKYGGGRSDAFVTRLSVDGTKLLGSTYLGGEDYDTSSGIALDSSGKVYVVGNTSSHKFPVTTGAFQQALKGYSNAFIAKIDPTTMSLVYSTYLGGGDWDEGNAIAVDSAGSAYVTGITESKNFPTTKGAFQESTLWEKYRFGVIFVSKLSPDGASLVYSTYLGGTSGNFVFGIALDSLGQAYITGGTGSTDFPTTLGAFQTKTSTSGTAFVTKLSVAGSYLLNSTYLGRNGITLANSIAIDSSRNAYVTGDTEATDFPISDGAFQKTNAGRKDVFVTKLSMTDIAGKADVDVNIVSSTIELGNPYAVATLTRKADGYLLVGRTLSFYWDDALMGIITTIGLGTKANLYIPNLTEGTHTLKVDFAGDGNYNPASTTDTVTVTKNKTQIQVDNAKGKPGDKITLKGQLTTVFDYPSGEILTFKVDGAMVGTSVTNNSGSASLDYTIADNFTSGVPEIKVEFAGDATYLPSVGTGVLTVVMTNTIIRMRSVTGYYGSTQSLKATLARSDTSATLSNKTITFKIDGTALGTATTDTSGVATLGYVMSDAFSVGDHTLTAEFAEDSRYTASTGTAKITFVQTTSVLSLNSLSGRIGETKSLTAPLTRATDKEGIAGKTITFTLAGTPIGTATTDSSGKAVLAYKLEEGFGVGKLTQNADFAGDNQYLKSTKSATLTVNQAPTKINPNNVSGKQGGKITLTATLIRTTDSKGLSGRVLKFQIDSKDVGTATTDANGGVSLSYTIPSTMSVGKHPITVIFDGDTYYLKYTATGNNLTVK